MTAYRAYRDKIDTIKRGIAGCEVSRTLTWHEIEALAIHVEAALQAADDNAANREFYDTVRRHSPTDSIDVDHD